MTVHDAFRQAGGAAGVHDVEQFVLAYRRRTVTALGTTVEQRPVIGEITAGAIHQQHVVGAQLRQLVAHLVEHRRQRTLGDQADGTRVAE
ncbi:MAG: hypothetical protein AW07_01379 [Candidatus Accumulibacter sp. SK-11]|nr:MAG: hypothetical protein AW07_01379 [Candidatus Accumulibacter sp. SK-11]